ncbi:hypothetical protein FRC18_001084 [Serendipita sp. 400]|nr:hypothetical protein FRC18_001084 [Serendipita sp. 400]
MVSWNSLLVTCLTVAGVYADVVKRDTTLTGSTSSSSISPPPASTSSSSCAVNWAQCGGQGFTGPTCCQGGWTCTYANPWFSHCLLPTSTTTPTSSSSPPPVSSSSSSVNTSVSCAINYAQCGGQGFTGPTCCQSGWTCTYTNPWYSSCLLPTSTITTSSSYSPPPASSSSSSVNTSVSCAVNYAQCGGQGFTGPTCCPSGWTCTYANPWYSSCL